MARPTRLHKPHEDDALPLDHVEELRALMVAYEDCPGIVGDLRALVDDLEERRATEGAA